MRDEDTNPKEATTKKRDPDKPKKKGLKKATSKASTRKAARELRDADYLHKLPPDERAWAEQFYDEYYHDNFPKKGAKHKTKKKKQDRYNANNARRRDIWNNYTRVDMDPDWMTGEDEDGKD